MEYIISENSIEYLIDVEIIMKYLRCCKSVAYRIIKECDPIKMKGKIITTHSRLIDYIEKEYGGSLADLKEGKRMQIHEAYGDFIKPQQAANILNQPINKIYKLIHNGSISAVKLGKTWIIPTFMLDEQLEWNPKFKEGLK